MQAHTPVVQVSPAPQVVPLATGVVLAVQVAAPVMGSQVYAATWHGSVGAVQLRPGVQAHTPVVQVSPAPQLVPFATLVPESTQTEVPVLHEVVPVWQGFAGVQATPAVQATQAPFEQT